MKRFCYFLLIFQLSCQAQTPTEGLKTPEDSLPNTNQKYEQLFSEQPAYKSDGFDYPVGKPNAKGYYNAQGFGGEKYHLGDDWNASTGGNSDIGHPIYAIGNGYVSLAENHGGGWGNVLRVVHWHNGQFVESLYAHCDEILVKKGDWVKRGQKIATIGNNNGMYLAHLHLEIRSEVDLPIGGGYSRNSKGYLDPTVFIKANRHKK